MTASSLHGSWVLGRARAPLPSYEPKTHSQPLPRVLGASSAAGGPSGGPRRYAGQALAGAQGQTKPEVAQTPADGREPTARMWPRAGSAQVRPADPLHRTWALSDFLAKMAIISFARRQLAS